mmetsp:Transcript_3493/g.10175  ORF Transcript_3493/g.10175 Transcript_3493/m.10175 type:complete len:207 (+) Transcript_3493:2-622(+)
MDATIAAQQAGKPNIHSHADRGQMSLQGSFAVSRSHREDRQAFVELLRLVCIVEHEYQGGDVVRVNTDREVLELLGEGGRSYELGASVYPQQLPDPDAAERDGRTCRRLAASQAWPEADVGPLQGEDMLGSLRSIMLEESQGYAFGGGFLHKGGHASVHVILNARHHIVEGLQVVDERFLLVIRELVKACCCCHRTSISHFTPAGR